MLRKLTHIYICLVLMTGILAGQELKGITTEFGSVELVQTLYTGNESYLMIYEGKDKHGLDRIKYKFIDNLSKIRNADAREITPLFFSNQNNAQVYQIKNDIVAVSWIDYRKDKDGDLFIQLIDKNGVIWDSAGVVVCDEKGKPQSISIGADNNGNIFVTWTDKRNSIYEEVYVQKFDIYGNEKWKRCGVQVSNIKAAKVNPQLAPDQTGGVFVGYTDMSNYFSQIYIQKFNENGKKEFGNYGKFISKPGVYSDSVHLFFDSELGLTAFWLSVEEYSIIKAQRISDKGIEEWSEDGEEITSLKGEQHFPKYYYINGSFYILFIKSDYSGNAIYAQKMSETGVVQFSSRGVKIAELKGNINTSLNLLPHQNNFLLYFLDSKNNNSEFELYVQTITEDGITTGQVECRKLINTTFRQNDNINIFARDNSMNLFVEKEFGGQKNIFTLSLTDKQEPTRKKGLEIINFEVSQFENYVRIWWVGINEAKGTQITLEKLTEGKDWNVLHIYQMSENSERKFNTFEDTSSNDGIVQYRIKYFDSDNKIQYTETKTVSMTSSQKPELLLQNSPNPFNNSTKITFKLVEPSFVKIIVYNGRAEKIMELVRDNFSAGIHDVIFTPPEYLSSGIYFYKIESNYYTDVKKMVYAK